MGGDKDDIFKNFSIDFGKKYGEGGYGATYSATDNKTGEALAVKIIDTRRMRQDAISKECQILENLQHPNIIAVKAHGPGKGKQAHLYFIFMELAAGGELFDQVIDRGANAMPESVARAFFCQILDGVAYCHVAGVAHRDLKLENVLLTAAGVVKVIDFGLSHVYPRSASGEIDRSRALKDECGSKSYAAPEILAKRGYDGYAADMWSLGVCLFAMLSGFFPLDEATPNDWRFGKMVETQLSSRSTTAAIYSWYKRCSAHLSVEVVHLLDSMLRLDPAKRAAMAEVREHPWVRDRKFGAAGAAADQGSYPSAELVGDDAPAYRGFAAGGEAVVVNEAPMDEEPVYRSLGLARAEDVPLPTLSRQRGRHASAWGVESTPLESIPTEC